MKTNEIWAESNIDRFHDEHIEIDEVIAPLIRELNIKGYKTKFCCSGHPFYSLCEAMVDSEETAKAFVGLIGTERTENPRVPVRALYVTQDNDFYITFEENEQKAIVLALPDGFEWDDERTIRYTYNNYEFYPKSNGARFTLVISAVRKVRFNVECVLYWSCRRIS